MLPRWSRHRRGDQCAQLRTSNLLIFHATLSPVFFASSYQQQSPRSLRMASKLTLLSTSLAPAYMQEASVNRRKRLCLRFTPGRTSRSAGTGGRLHLSLQKITACTLIRQHRFPRDGGAMLRTAQVEGRLSVTDFTDSRLRDVVHCNHRPGLLFVSGPKSSQHFRSCYQSL